MRRTAFGCVLGTGVLCALAAAEPASGPVSTPASIPGGMPATTPGSLPASFYAGMPRLTLQQKLATANKQVETRGAEISKQVQEAEAAIKELESKPSDGQTAAQEDKLIADRATLQSELSQLQAKVSAYRSAVESADSLAQLREELKLYKARQAKQPVTPGVAEVEALQAQLAQAQSLKEGIQRLNTSRIQRLTEMQAAIEKAGQGKDPLLEAKRDALLAQVEASQQSYATFDAQIELLVAKLPADAALAPRQVLTSRAAEEQAAEVMQKLAVARRTNARNALEEAREKRKEALDRVSALTSKGADSTDAENEYEYWNRKYDYENRNTKLADADARKAAEKHNAAEIQRQIETVRAAFEELGKTIEGLSPQERSKQAAQFRSNARLAEEDAKGLEQQGRENIGADVWLNMLKSIQATRKALEERHTKLLSAWDDQTLPTEREDARSSQARSDHVRRMLSLVDTELQQVSAGMNIVEAMQYAIKLQASYKRELAAVYTQCADLLAPPQPSFWERQRNTINSIKIFIVALAAVYAVKLAIWFIQRGARSIAAGVARGRFSIKRVETLLKFFGSIFKLFIWLFAVVLVLNEYGIDPAKSTGAIGLVGLILAGMFQQIVIDIVKGLDIITGRHYNVGDFVELDGKSGHVIDFSMTHTRIRTASGQEYNLPNSKCIPSRRFPDGYVDNYVDFALRSASDVHNARKALSRVCRHLSRRIEQVKEEPVLADKFPGARPGSFMLRYRVRILPASDWVITSQFIPAAKVALAAENVELAEEPAFFFLNRIQTFRQLFSRELSEEEILREANESDRPITAEQDTSASQEGAHTTAAEAGSCAEGAQTASDVAATGISN